MLLLRSFFRLKELFQMKNGLTKSLLLFFFFENAKNLGRSDDAKRRKKGGWPYGCCLTMHISFSLCCALNRRTILSGYIKAQVFSISDSFFNWDSLVLN